MSSMNRNILHSSSSDLTAWDEACTSWDDLYRGVIYFRTHRLRKLLESERSGDGISATEALDDAAALASDARMFFDAVQQMANDEEG